MTKRESGNRFVIPALALLSVVTLYPIVYVFYLSLQRKLLIFNISRFIGVENYVFLLRDERFWNALRNTVYFTAVSVSLELVLGLCIAMLLNRHFRGKGMVRALVLIPWAIPTSYLRRCGNGCTIQILVF
jgi:multiple sugar transport system permease protein